MIEPRNPSEIAREALKRLAVRQLAPTPANYQACFNEIANLPDGAPFPEPQLRQLAQSLSVRGSTGPEVLAQLNAAIGRRSWLAVQEAMQACINAGEGPAVVREVAVSPLANALPAEFALRLARFVESILPALGDENPKVELMSSELLQALREPPVEIAETQGRLAKLGHLAQYAAEEQLEIKESLLNLLHLIIENVGELSIDDSWLKGQVDGLLAAVAPPLTLRHLDEMGRRLRDVMAKQSEAKRRSVEAQEEMRQMLAAFIERLASINESSTVFQEQIEASAQRIESIQRIEDLAPLLEELIGATRSMADASSNTREELKRLQDRVLASEAELVHLHLELDHASALARHDPLTDALNRKGLDEAMAREIATMRRKETPLSLSLIDIDNFKKLNDRLGHDAGDDALVHLATVARGCMRPSDTLARYGGEEFIILMPDTTLEQGVEVITRLQRELTKAFFMTGNEKILITFSAGVAQLAADEEGGEAITRADRAMYLAKRAGKNRVMGA